MRHFLYCAFFFSSPKTLKVLLSGLTGHFLTSPSATLCLSRWQLVEINFSQPFLPALLFGLRVCATVECFDRGPGLLFPYVVDGMTDSFPTSFLYLSCYLGRFPRLPLRICRVSLCTFLTSMPFVLMSSAVPATRSVKEPGLPTIS